MNLIILVLYLVSLYITGAMIVMRLFTNLPRLLAFAGSALVGVGVGVPVTYLSACVFAWTEYPILYGVSVVSIAVISCWILVARKSIKEQRTNNKKLTPSDVLLLMFSLTVSTWIMTKTFHGNVAGELFVGSNNVFDFGLLVGLVRSVSQGANIPFASPFFAGLPLFYHFFFLFWCATWEYFGVPIVWAINIPSILSFTALLIMVYFLPQILLKQRAFVGWIAVTLTITHSTLTFWHLVIEKGFNLSFLHALWRLPTYPYAGPFDGSVISIFMTLNNYVNQRHLAFGVALGLFLIMCVTKLLDDKRLHPVHGAVVGALTGGMFFWNMPLSLITGVTIVLVLFFKKRWKEIIIFVCVALTMTGISLIPFISSWKNLLSFLLVLQNVGVGGAARNLPAWSIGQYLWENLGILPFVAVFGLFAVPKNRRYAVLPFLLLFGGLCAVASYGKRGFDQKFLSFLIIGVNVIAAAGIGWLMESRKIGLKALALITFFILTVSGGVDLMAVKNEFAFPLVDKKMLPVVSWIRDNTDKNATFISYADMIDPVVIAGRKNYFGYFGNTGWFDRSPVVTQIYGGDRAAAKPHTISHILVPKWQKNDFPYAPDVPLLRQKMTVVYEDDRYIVLEVR